MAKAKVKAANQQSKQFFESMHQVVSDKGFDREEVFEIIEAGLIAAYRKKFNSKENIRVVFDKEKDDVYVLATRSVVDNVVMPGMQISLEEARAINPEAQIGNEMEIEERPIEYGRIAAQTAMQVVSQRLRNLEQNKLRAEYESKAGELMNGYILRKKADTIFVDLGKIEAVMPIRHQVPGERYRTEDKIKVLLYSIESDPRGLRAVVSRADKKFVQKLFEMEIPEIYDRIVEIRNIARVPGIRTKVVVASNRYDVDPVGACVGPRGVRIQSIIRELGNERIDIVEYSQDPRELIINAMTPATPSTVKVDPSNKEALVVIPDKDLSIAIGREGSNVKLASQVTGFRLDVKSESQFSDEMSSPEARKRLDELFAKPIEEDEDEEQGTPLTELPGLTRRIINILADGGIRYIEDIVSMSEEDLVSIEGIGTSTALRILEILAENVVFEEEDDDEPASNIEGDTPQA